MFLCVSKIKIHRVPEFQKPSVSVLGETPLHDVTHITKCLSVFQRQCG